MPMGLYITTFCMAVAGEAALGNDIIDLGSRLGNMTTAGVLGVIAVVSFAMIWKLYSNTLRIAEKAIGSIETNNAKVTEQTNVIKQMHEDISLCRKLNVQKLKEARLKDTQDIKEI